MNDQVRNERIKIYKAHKMDKSIMKFISPQMDKFVIDESKLLSHKIDGFIRARDEHTRTNKQHTYWKWWIWNTINKVKFLQTEPKKQKGIVWKLD